MIVHGSGDFTLEDLRRGVTAVSRGSTARTICITSLSIALLVCGVLMLWRRSADSFGALLLPAGVILAFLHWIGPILASHRYWKKDPNLRGHREIDLDETGYKMKFPNGHVEVAWPGFQKWRETEHLFLLFTHPRVAQMVPKHFFAGQSDVDAARKLITQHIPKGKSQRK